MAGETCVVCGSSRQREVASISEWRAWWKDRSPDSGMKRAISVSSRIGDLRSFVQCRDCALYRVQAMPTAAEVAPLYDDYAVYAGKTDAKIRRATRRLRRLRHKGTKETFLDVGANFGFTTEAARRLGFLSHGIDIDADAIAAGQREFPETHLECTTAEAFATSGFQADLVYCSEVIEHLAEPREFAAALARLVKPGGTLYLTTPDAGHWRRPARFVAWKEVKPPEHLIWFSKENLRRLLTDVGFSRLRFAATLKPGIRLTAQH